MGLLRLFLTQERPAVREMIRNSPGWVIYERTRTGNWPTSRERAWVVGKRQRQFGTNKGNETGIGDIMRFRHPDGEARRTQHVRSPSMKMRGGPGSRMIDERGAYQKNAGINNPSVVFFSPPVKPRRVQSECMRAIPMTSGARPLLCGRESRTALWRFSI